MDGIQVMDMYRGGQDEMKYEHDNGDNDPQSPDEKYEYTPDISRQTTHQTLQCHTLSSAVTIRPSITISAAERARRNLNIRLSNPLGDYTYPELCKMGRAYAIDQGLTAAEDMRAFEIGACLARDPTKLIDEAKQLGATDNEIETLENETKKRWSQPKRLYWVIAICSVCAAVQGMDETVVNGAQLFYFEQFGIAGSDPRSTWLGGLINGAPYMCCAFVGCWLTTPFNHWLGRRGTIFVTCFVSAVACFWQGFVNTWWHMFIARFILGIGIGPKSATVPIYAAECAPPGIRGALVMQWQLWTAFGIMLGLASDLIFYHVSDTPSITGLNWRLMMASAMFPAVIVCMLVFSVCPESPRWYMAMGRHAAAYEAMCKLRFCKVQAARDIFYMKELLRREEGMRIGQSWIKELVGVVRNRRALVASEIVMFMQQFCGINVIAYFSSKIFRDSGFTNQAALAASFGFGVINFVFSIPAITTIDTLGRRTLLLITLPLLTVTLLITGFSFLIPSHTTNPRLACIAIGIYLFGVFYSPGMGPVPFTYSAEAYPLYIRTIGMSLATATTWFCNWILSITWLSLLAGFGPTGAFAWYAGWCVLGWWGVLLLLPETKGRSLEELEQVFAVPTRDHARYGLRQISYVFQKFLLRKDIQPAKLYEEDEGGCNRGIATGMDVV